MSPSFHFLKSEALESPQTLLLSSHSTSNSLKKSQNISKIFPLHTYTHFSRFWPLPALGPSYHPLPWIISVALQETSLLVQPCHYSIRSQYSNQHNPIKTNLAYDTLLRKAFQLLYISHSVKIKALTMAYEALRKLRPSEPISCPLVNSPLAIVPFGHSLNPLPWSQLRAFALATPLAKMLFPLKIADSLSNSFDLSAAQGCVLGTPFYKQKPTFPPRIRCSSLQLYLIPSTFIIV